MLCQINRLVIVSQFRDQKKFNMRGEISAFDLPLNFLAMTALFCLALRRCTRKVCLQLLDVHLQSSVSQNNPLPTRIVSSPRNVNVP